MLTAPERDNGWIASAAEVLAPGKETLQDEIANLLAHYGTKAVLAAIADAAEDAADHLLDTDAPDGGPAVRSVCAHVATSLRTAIGGL